MTDMSYCLRQVLSGISLVLSGVSLVLSGVLTREPPQIIRSYWYLPTAQSVPPSDMDITAHTNKMALVRIPVPFVFLILIFYLVFQDKLCENAVRTTAPSIPPGLPSGAILKIYFQ